MPRCSTRDRYPSYIGTRKALDFVDYGPLLASMHGKRHGWPPRYRAFVEGGLAESDEDFQVALKQSPRSIGGDGFRAWIDDLYQDRLEAHARPEDVSLRHIGRSLPANDVLHKLAAIFGVETDEFRRRRHNSPLRAAAARMLIRYAGLTQRDVAVLLNCGSGSAVCKQITRLAEKLSADRQLFRKIERAEECLEEALRAGRLKRG
jgi:hypothetical protein